MFDVYIWHYQEYKLGTFSSFEIANKAKNKILEINPDQKIWIDPVVCNDSIHNTTARYRVLKGSLLNVS